MKKEVIKMFQLRDQKHQNKLFPSSLRLASRIRSGPLFCIINNHRKLPNLMEKSTYYTTSRMSFTDRHGNNPPNVQVKCAVSQLDTAH